MYELIVTRPFGLRTPGYHITDPAEIDAVLSGPNANAVVKTFAPPAALDPAPAPSMPAPPAKIVAPLPMKPLAPSSDAPSPDKPSS